LTIISFINGGFKGAKPLVIEIPLIIGRYSYSYHGEGDKGVRVIINLQTIIDDSRVI